MTDKVTVVIDNKEAYSCHSIYFVECSSLDEAHALARVVDAFGKCQVEAIGSLDWWKGEPSKLQDSNPRNREWASEAFGEDCFAESILSQILSTEDDPYDWHDMRGIPSRVDVSDLRMFPNINVLRLLADAIESGAISQCR